MRVRALEKKTRSVANRMKPISYGEGPCGGQRRLESQEKEVRPGSDTSVKQISRHRLTNKSFGSRTFLERRPYKVRETLTIRKRSYTVKKGGNREN